MIRATTLDRLFSPERQRRQAASIDHGGGFATPVMSERLVTPEDLPVLSSNMKGRFVRPGVAHEGRVRFAFFECAIEDEGQALVELQRQLLKLVECHDWSNAHRSLEGARNFMRAHSLEPHSLVLPRDELEVVCGADLDDDVIDRLVTTTGFVAEVDGLHVLPGPPGVALLLAAPALAGVYSRVDDRLGLLVTRADRAVVVIEDGLA